MTSETNPDLSESTEIPEALPGRIIVQFPRPKTRTAAGLHIPQQSQHIDRHVAKVIDVGAPVDEADRLFVGIVRKGDKVIAHPRYGTPFNVVDANGEATEYRIFRMFEITGKAARRSHASAPALEQMAA